MKSATSWNISSVRDIVVVAMGSRTAIAAVNCKIGETAAARVKKERRATTDLTLGLLPVTLFRS